MTNRVLVSIIDDDEPFRDSMRKIIMLLGYAVESFPSAADFLRSHFVPEAACLVADVNMPGMTGLELHKHLAEQGHEIPTILVTAYFDEIMRERALRDGVAFFLSKPVDDEELEQCIRSALKLRKPDKLGS